MVGIVPVVSPAYTILKDMFLYLKVRAEYIENLEANLRKVTSQIVIFHSRKKQIERILQTAVSKEVTEEYNELLKQAEEFQKQYNKFMLKYHKHCQNLPSISKELETLTESQFTEKYDHDSGNVIYVLEREPKILTHKFFKLAELSRDTKKLYDDIVQIINCMKTENLIMEKSVEPVIRQCDTANIPSFRLYVEEILMYLSEDENKYVGIMGPIGVGKTTVLKMLNNHLKDASSPLFSVVIWISLDEKDESIARMQDIIMDRLKLKNTGFADKNAVIISDALMHKKYVLLIDQVTSKVNFELVGVSGKHSFGKIIVVSSSRKVIKEMTDCQVEVQALSKADSLGLFLKFCGKISDMGIKLTAESIAASCGGLPHVIKLVAEHLKGEKDVCVWRHVKSILESKPSSKKFLFMGGLDNAYKSMCDKLDAQYLKCLLFAALFPNGHNIYKDYLIECWHAEGFLDPINPGLIGSRDCGSSALKCLTDCYLLERNSDTHIKMPVLFRKLALEQNFPEENSTFWAPQMDKILDTDTWQTARRISLIPIPSELPKRPKNHYLSALLLQKNLEIATLGDSFFQNMRSLLILDLHQTGIKSLPRSISRLNNLVSLYLNSCSSLTELPPEVRKLKNLEVLDIRGTSIRQLPDEIGDLFGLKCLRIAVSKKGCHRRIKGKGVEMVIPPNIISRLQQLEELTIEVGCCFDGWNDNADQLVCELICLEKLNVLVFHFPNVTALKKFVMEGKYLKNVMKLSFKISVGCCDVHHPYGSDISGPFGIRTLRYCTNEKIDSAREVLAFASSFELVDNCSVESLSEYHLETQNLNVCILERCQKLSSVVDTTVKTNCVAFRSLEKMHLFDLESLKCVWNGPVYPGCLANLTVLTLFGCPGLTKVLNLELAKALSSLKHMKVENCSNIVEIVVIRNPVVQEIEGLGDLSDILPKVKTIVLVQLPKLKSICKNNSVHWNSLRILEIITCKKLRNIDSTLKNRGMLKTIKCEAAWWAAVDLADEEKQGLSSLITLLDVGARP